MGKYASAIFLSLSLLFAHTVLAKQDQKTKQKSAEEIYKEQLDNLHTLLSIVKKNIDPDNKLNGQRLQRAHKAQIWLRKYVYEQNKKLTELSSNDKKAYEKLTPQVALLNSTAPAVLNIFSGIEALETFDCTLELTPKNTSNQKQSIKLISDQMAQTGGLNIIRRKGSELAFASSDEKSEVEASISVSFSQFIDEKSGDTQGSSLGITGTDEANVTFSSSLTFPRSSELSKEFRLRAETSLNEVQLSCIRR